MSIGSTRRRPSISRAGAASASPAPACGASRTRAQVEMTEAHVEIHELRKYERVDNIMVADGALWGNELPVSDSDIDLGRCDVVIDFEILAVREDLRGDIVPHKNVL